MNKQSYWNRKNVVLGKGIDWLSFNRRIFGIKVPYNMGYADASMLVNLYGKAFGE